MAAKTTLTVIYVWQKPSSEKCPKCGSYMVEKEIAFSVPMSSADIV